MPENPRIIETSFHVRYAETDAMGIVHHSAYIVYLEESRSNYIRQCGSSYADMEADGYFLGVTEVYARYLRPARFDDFITMRTRVTELRSRSLTFTYEIVNTNDDILVTANSKHICTNRQGQAIRIPDKWKAWVNSD